MRWGEALLAAENTPGLKLSRGLSLDLIRGLVLVRFGHDQAGLSLATTTTETGCDLARLPSRLGQRHNQEL